MENFVQQDISQVVRIRCAECADFDLCVECFSVGVEVFPHKVGILSKVVNVFQNDHKYRVIEHVTTPIFEEDWGADDELLLLEAIEMCTHLVLVLFIVARLAGTVWAIGATSPITSARARQRSGASNIITTSSCLRPQRRFPT